MTTSMLKKIEAKDKRATRAGFGSAMCQLGLENPDIVVLCADLSGSLQLGDFIQSFPDRFFNAGVAEANMIGVAAGLATGGKIPYATTFANFATGRVYDQIRQSVAYSNKNVKICASHSGLTLGEDGATHQILEDIGLMRMLPNMTVINSCDFNQTKAATISIADYKGPVYLRFGRPSVPNFTGEDEIFEIGKALTLSEGSEVTILATGHLLWKAVQAGLILQEKGYDPEVINIHTIKPLDEEAILKSALKTRCVVTAEEHNKYGGLGEVVAHLLAKKMPTPMEMVAVNDEFGESGTPDELMAKYHIDTPDVVDAALKVMGRKG